MKVISFFLLLLEEQFQLFEVPFWCVFCVCVLFVCASQKENVISSLILKTLMIEYEEER